MQDGLISLFNMGRYTGVVRRLSYAVDIGNGLLYIVMAGFGAPRRKILDVHKITKTRLKNVAHNVRKIGSI